MCCLMYVTTSERLLKPECYTRRWALFNLGAACYLFHILGVQTGRLTRHLEQMKRQAESHQFFMPVF